MPIISVRDNENNRQKRKANKQTNKKTRRKRTRVTRAIVKGSEVNDFVERLS